MTQKKLSSHELMPGTTSIGSYMPPKYMFQNPRKPRESQQYVEYDKLIVHNVASSRQEFG